MFHLIGSTLEKSSVSTFCEGAISRYVNLVCACIHPGDIPNKYHVDGKLSGGTLCFLKLFRDLDRITSMPVPLAEAISLLSAVRVPQCVNHSSMLREGDLPALSFLFPGENHECSEFIEGPHLLPHDWPKGSELECVGDFQIRFFFFMDNVDCKQSHDLFVLLPYHSTLELPAPCCSGLCSDKDLWWQSLLWGGGCSLCGMD